MESKLDFGNGPLLGLLCKLFVPTIVGMLFNALFLVVDGIFIGKGIGPDGLAAVNLFEPILCLYIGIGTMIGAGCSVQTAMDLSRKNTQGARACVTRAYALTLIVCLVTSLIFYLFPHTILVMIGATETLEPIAIEYYRWFIPSGCFTTIQIASAFTIRLDGSPRYVMMSNIVATSINIILDYLFIFKYGLGMRGAAMATNIGIGTGALMMVYYVFFACKGLRPVRHAGLSGTAKILKLGSPSFLGEISAGTVSLLGNIMFGKYLADKGIAAFSIICYLTPIVYTVFIALSSSIQPIVSFNHGCGNIERVKKTLKLGLISSLVCALTVSSLLFIFSWSVVSAFLESGTDAHTIAGKGIRLFAIAYLFSGINMIIITFLQSIEKIRLSMAFTILRCFVYISVAFVVMPSIVGHVGLWLAVPVSEFATLITCVAYLSAKYFKHQYGK